MSDQGFREELIALTMKARECSRAEAEVIIDRVAERLGGQYTRGGCGDVPVAWEDGSGSRMNTRLYPRDVPDAHALIRRLCALQALVVTEVLGHDDPADCFCGDEGFWPYTNSADYRNAGKAVEFIETATLEAINNARAGVGETEAE